MKKWLKILFLICLVSVPIALAAESYWDTPTLGFLYTIFCRLTGCTMEGDIDMGGHNIFNVTNFTSVTTNVMNLNLTGNITANYYCDAATGLCYSMANLNWTPPRLDSNVSNNTFQLSNLSNYVISLTNATDTNASTACDDGEYLDGSGHCFNFNATVGNLTTSHTYYPTNVTEFQGTLSGGNNIDNISYYDGHFFNVTEGSGADSILLYVNFTGVSNFDSLLMREQYIAGVSSHTINIEIWNYIDSVWDNYYIIIAQSAEVVIHLPVPDSPEHISNGNVQVRFDHQQTGVSTHKLVIDFIQLVDGFSTITTVEHDGLSGRSDLKNHPQYMSAIGGRNFTADVNITSPYGIRLNNTLVNDWRMINGTNALNLTSVWAKFTEVMTSLLNLGTNQTNTTDRLDALNKSVITLKVSITNLEANIDYSNDYIKSLINETDTNCSVTNSCKTNIYYNNLSWIITNQNYTIHSQILNAMENLTSLNISIVSPEVIYSNISNNTFQLANQSNYMISLANETDTNCNLTGSCPTSLYYQRINNTGDFNTSGTIAGTSIDIRYTDLRMFIENGILVIEG